MLLNAKTQEKFEISKKTLWKIELEIMQLIDKICVENKIHYFLIGGALIGAVRHNGFIPWDDDIDIAMLRPDYEKFLQVAGNYMDDTYFLQTVYTEPCYFSDLVRVRQSLSTGILAQDIGKRCNNGIFVEIYVYDKVPENRFLKVLRGKELKIIISLLNDYYNDMPCKSTARKLIKTFSKLYCKIIPFMWTYHLWESVRRQYINTDSAIVSCESCTRLNDTDRSEWNYEDVKDTIRVPFENLQLCIPKNYDNCLRKCYGDYMTFPPVEERMYHHSTNVFYDPFRPYTDYQNSEELYKKLLSEIKESL